MAKVTCSLCGLSWRTRSRQPRCHRCNSRRVYFGWQLALARLRGSNA